MDTRTTIYLEEETLKKLKVFAAQHGRTIKDIINDALLMYFMEGERDDRTKD